MIINHILEIYLIFFVSAFLHESAHAVAAKAIGLTIREFKVGDDLFAVKIGKVSISPNSTFGSHVAFDSGELREKSIKQITAFFLSGPAVTLALMLAGLIFMKESPLYAGVLFWSNVYLFAGGMCPLILKNNDLNKLISYLTGRKA